MPDGGEEAANQDHESDRDERDRHRREDQATAVPEPGYARDEDEQANSEQDPVRREPRQVRDDRRGAGGDADRNRQGVVDDQRSQGQERPALAEGGAGRGSVTSSFGKARVELVVVQRDEPDDPEHEGHRRHEQAQVAVQRA